MAAEELVQRVLAGDVDRQPAPPPPRPAPHLAQRRDRPRKRHDDRGVQRADVDPQLQRVGRDDRQQLAAHQPPLELAALLGRVAGAVGDDEVLELRVGEADHPRDELDRLARLDEADRARPAPRQLADDLGRLAQRGRARAERLVGQRRVPHRDLAPRARRAVAVHQRDLLQPGQPLGQLAPGWRSSRWRAGSAARCRRRWRSAAAAAARWRRASRTRRGRRAPRRRRRPRGSRRSRPTGGGGAGSPCAACRGW